MYTFLKHSILILCITIAGCGKQMQKDTETAKSNATSNAVQLDKMHNAIAGQWVSTEDEKSHLAFTNKNTRTDDYNGFEPSAKPYTLAFSCNGNEQTDTVYIVSGSLCWSINEVTKNTLELTFMGRGNTLAYRRPKNVM